MTINKVIKSSVESYLLKYPNQSYNSIANKSGVHSTTLKNILAGESNPSALTALSVLSNTSNASIDDIKPYYSDTELNKAVNKRYGAGKEVNDTDRIMLEKERAAVTANCDVSHYLYTICQSGQITKEYASTNFGNYGLQILESFNKVGILEDKGNYYKLKHHKVIRSFQDYKKVLKYSVESVKESDIGTGSQILHAGQVGISEEGSNTLYGIYSSMMKKVNEVIRENPGDVPVNLGMIFKKLKKTVICLFLLGFIHVSQQSIAYNKSKLPEIYNKKPTTPSKDQSGSDLGGFGYKQLAKKSKFYC